MTPDLTRRALIGGLVCSPLLTAMKATPASVAPVVSIHLDQPWIDPTGLSHAYRPPVSYGLRYPDEALRDRIWL